MKIKMPQAPKSPIKFWTLVLGIPFAFIAVFMFLLVYQGSTKEILSVADKFRPGDGWVLESEHVEPPRFACLNSVSCPSVHRLWSVEDDLSINDFKALLDRSGWNFNISRNCLIPMNVSGTKGSVCEARGKIDEYPVLVTLNKSSSHMNETDVVLYIN